jgi:hypothetical protein
VDLSEYRMKETGSCTRSWLLTLARYYRIVQKSRWCWNLSHLLSLSATFAFHTGLFAEFEFPTYCAMHHLHPIPEPGPVEAISFLILTGRLRPFMWFAAFRSPKACCSLAVFRCFPHGWYTSLMLHAHEAPNQIWTVPWAWGSMQGAKGSCGVLQSRG